MTGIFVYMSCLSGEELLTFDDGPTELPGSLQQPNSAIGWNMHKHALTQCWHMYVQHSHTCVRLHQSLQDTIHNSVINSVAHVDQVLIKTQCLLCRSAKQSTIHNIFSMRHHSEPHLWIGSSNIFLSLISVGSDKTLHVHLVSSGPCGATFHSVAGTGCMT